MLSFCRQRDFRSRLYQWIASFLIYLFYLLGITMCWWLLLSSKFKFRYFFVTLFTNQGQWVHGHKFFDSRWAYRKKNVEKLMLWVRIVFTRTRNPPTRLINKKRCILSVWCRCGADVLPQLSFDLSLTKLLFENIMYIMFLLLSCLHKANRNLQFWISQLKSHLLLWSTYMELL